MTAQDLEIGVETLKIEKKAEKIENAWFLSMKITKVTNENENLTIEEKQKVEKTENNWQTRWNLYLGDCTLIQSKLKKKPLSDPLWGIAHFCNILLRSVGQTVFVNNPFLSILIFVGIAFSKKEAGLGCALGGVLSTCTELFLGLHPWSLVENGVAPFNGALIGSVLPSLYPLLHASGHIVQMWMAVIIGSVASVFLASALNNFLGKHDLPYMTLPFNIISICTFLSLLPSQHHSISNTAVPDNFTLSPPEDVSISWPGVGQGIVLSMGQVYAVDDLLSSCLMCIAMTLYSPVLLVMSMLGATLGCLLPLSLLPPGQYYQIYQGLWGYNPLLSMAAMSCVFNAFSGSSLLAGTVSSVLTVVIQKALARTLTQASLPVFTLPFTLATLVMLLSWQQKGKREGPGAGSTISTEVS